MNLEHIEQRCLKYLKQSKNPMVAFDQLLKHCEEDGACAGVNGAMLMEFLRRHEEVRVLDGPGEGEPVGVDTFAAAGLIMGTRIIHRDRVPTQLELIVLIKEHISGMVSSLEAALENPGLGGDPDRRAQLEAALERAHNLKRKIGDRL